MPRRCKAQRKGGAVVEGARGGGSEPAALSAFVHEALTCARVQRALDLLGATVPPQLVAAAALRLANREASLKELGPRADPPLTKDAMAGRLRRLLARADDHAARTWVPHPLPDRSDQRGST